MSAATTREPARWVTLAGLARELRVSGPSVTRRRAFFVDVPQRPSSAKGAPLEYLRDAAMRVFAPEMRKIRQYQEARNGELNLERHARKESSPDCVIDLRALETRAGEYLSVDSICSIVGLAKGTVRKRLGTVRRRKVRAGYHHSVDDFLVILRRDRAQLEDRRRLLGPSRRPRAAVDAEPDGVPIPACEACGAFEGTPEARVACFVPARGAERITRIGTLCGRELCPGAVEGLGVLAEWPIDNVTEQIVLQAVHAVPLAPYAAARLHDLFAEIVHLRREAQR